MSGRIALIDRGNCFFVDKVHNVQQVGAIGAVIVNNAGNQVLSMAGVNSAISIPSVFIGQRNGEFIRAAVAEGVVVSLASRPGPDWVDSAFANGTIIHEYAHGVTTRLSGGALNASCLSAPESAGMGEGWSDFYELAFTAGPEDQRRDRRPVGTFVSGEPPTGAGIRTFPYSTALAIHPLTYADIADIPVEDQPHDPGEAWTLALWEVYWNLVDEYGFDTDLVFGSGGNNLMLQLVTDALKLQPCEPTFVAGRDALLLADQVLTDGANQCAIWRGFARRGVGLGADDGSGPNDLDVAEAFDVPVACPEPAGWGLGLVALLVVAGLRRRA